MTNQSTDKEYLYWWPWNWCADSFPVALKKQKTFTSECRYNYMPAHARKLLTFTPQLTVSINWPGILLLLENYTHTVHVYLFNWQNCTLSSLHSYRCTHSPPITITSTNHQFACTRLLIATLNELACTPAWVIQRGTPVVTTHNI